MARGACIIGGSRGGMRDARPPLGVRILSISCSFRENLACSRPPGGFTPPPRENPGSATVHVKEDVHGKGCMHGEGIHGKWGVHGRGDACRRDGH